MVRNYFKNAKHWARANEPLLWSVAELTALLIALPVTAKATIDTYKAIEKKKKETGEEKLPVKEVAKIVIPKYTPVFVLVITGGVCAIQSNRKNAARIAGLSTIATLAERKAESLTAAAVEATGKKKAEDVKIRAAEKEALADRTSGTLSEMNIIKTGRGETLFRLDFTGQYFRSSVNEIDAALNRFNRVWGDLNEDAQSLADLTDELNIDRTVCGSICGWYRTDLDRDGVYFRKVWAEDPITHEGFCTLSFPEAITPRNYFWKAKDEMIFG